MKLHTYVVLNEQGSSSMCYVIFTICICVFQMFFFFPPSLDLTKLEKCMTFSSHINLLLHNHFPQK